MKRIIHVVLFLLPVVSLAQQGDWQELFNGKDLKGWKQLNGKARYEVRNGMIIGSTVPDEPNSFLATEKDYGDFVLELEFLVDSTMNSGIQFRSESKPDYRRISWGQCRGNAALLDESIERDCCRVDRSGGQERRPNP